MGIISKDENLIKLYYNSRTSIGKQSYSYVASTEKDFVGIDTSKTSVPGSHWAEIAKGLGIDVRKLVDKDHPNFTQEYGDEKPDFENHDWLKILEKHPEVLAYPIAIVGEQFVLIESPSEALNL